MKFKVVRLKARKGILKTHLKVGVSKVRLISSVRYPSFG